MPRGMADLLDQPAREHGFRLAEAPDVACGVGRHAVALAERGVDICGADLSPAVPEGIYRRVAAAASS
jgi:2-polyprenyl-3-methyl-5-hydroxy-6-metoxy-1,4-benzoquinol methylase